MNNLPQIKIGHNLYEIEPDSENVAFDKNDVCYQVFRTKDNMVEGPGTIGRYRFIFGKDWELVATAPPLLNFGRNHDMVSVASLRTAQTRIYAFDNLNSKNGWYDQAN